MTWRLHGIALPDGSELPWENLATNPPQRGTAVSHLLEQSPEQHRLAEAVNHFGGHASSIFARNSLSDLAALHSAALAVHDLVPTPQVGHALGVLVGQIAATAQDWNTVESREWARPGDLRSPEADAARRTFLQATQGRESEVARLQDAIDLFLGAVESEWLAGARR